MPAGAVSVSVSGTGARLAARVETDTLDAMPVRRTKRGADRTPLSGSYDVLICGASFAGLAVARELAGSGARVLMIDRYDIGERQTSACAMPTEWMQALGVVDALRQTFSDLVIHTPFNTTRYELPWTFSTFDYRTLCRLLDDQNEAVFETAKVNGRTGFTVHTDRGDLIAPLVVDALGWKRMVGEPTQPPDARLARGLEVHPGGSGEDLELWLDARYVRPGYSWSFPAGEEVRVGVGSFAPRIHVRGPTVQLAGALGRDAVRYQGNWIPHELRSATDDGVFFAGDSAGHCLPTTAEGIRTALYFGLACGRELRRVIEGDQSRERALARYAAFSASHRRAFTWLWRVQSLFSGLNATPAMDGVMQVFRSRRLVTWSFTRYLEIAPPEFALESPALSPEQPAAAAAAAA